MSADDISAFRSELLRQRVIFEAELRRQREASDARFQAIARVLEAREADCRNLQSVVTILGKRVDSLTDQRTPIQRSSTPIRSQPAHNKSSENVRTRVSSTEKAPSNLGSLIPSSVSVNRISSASRKTHSPRRYSELTSGSMRTTVRGFSGQ